LQIFTPSAMTWRSGTARAFRAERLYDRLAERGYAP
jgi:hypothetical protein